MLQLSQLAYQINTVKYVGVIMKAGFIKLMRHLNNLRKHHELSTKMYNQRLFETFKGYALQLLACVKDQISASLMVSKLIYHPAPYAYVRVCIEN